MKYSILFILLFLFGGILSVYSVEADEAYVSGENADTLFKKNEAFNTALSLYMQLSHKTDNDSAKLDFNIGNTLFQLQEYPWAIVYYTQALLKLPHDMNIRNNLKLAQEKLGIEARVPVAFHDHSPISLFTCLLIFISLSVVSLSAHIWFQTTLSRRLFYFSFSIYLVLMLFTGYFKYFSTVEGVLVKATFLNRAPIEKVNTVGNLPLLPGNKVTVLSEAKDGYWLKIMTSDGDIGYVSSSTIYLISNLSVQ